MLGHFFFFLDLSQFLHVGFVLVNKHCPVFFFAGLLFVFEKDAAKVKVRSKFALIHGIAASFGHLLLNEKQKKPFVSLNNEVSEASYQPLAARADKSNVLV